MDFAPDDTAVAVRDVANDVFARHETVWSSTFDDHPFDEVLWRSLVDAGVITLPLPAESSGDGVGVLGLMPLLRRMGSAAAVTPALGTLAAALAIFDVNADGTGAIDPPTRTRLAGSLADGGWWSVAVSEPGDALSLAPRTTVVDGRLTGTKSAVLHAEQAGALFVTTDRGVVVIDPSEKGVALQRTWSSSGAGEYTVIFDDVALADDALIGVPPQRLRDAYRLVLAAYGDGLIAGATELTARHASERNQFGKPIALFQAVGQQLADIYVIGRSMNLVTISAAWRISEGLDAQRDLGIAGYWLAAEIPATLRTMTHLHGGVGVDITYPLHRYFSIAKDLARIVGGGDAQLDELADLAERTSSDVEPERAEVAGVH